MQKLAYGFGLALLAAVGVSAPAHAQGMPQGPYMDTCSGARVDGQALIARCRDDAGVEQHSALVNFDRCTGDITNKNGVLSCSMRVAMPVAAPAPEPTITRVAVDCDELRRQDADLHARMNAPMDPVDRGRLEGELHQVQGQEDHCTR